MATRRSVLWSTAAFASGRAATFLSVLVLARILTPSDFGAVAAIVVYLAVLELIADLGMRAAVIYEQEHGVGRRVDTAFTINLGLAVVLCGAGVAAAPLVAHFFAIPEHTGLFRLAALILLVNGTANVHDSLLMRDLAFRRRMVPALARSATRAVVGIGLALAGLQAAALVVGMVAGAVVWAVAQWVVCPRRPRLAFDRAAARAMTRYGVGAAALQLLAAVGTRIDAVVVGRVLGDSALGLYTLAYRVPELLVGTVAWNVSDVAFPALAAKRERDRAGLGSAVVELVRMQALVTVPLAAGLAVLASPIVVVLFSQTWSAAGAIMPGIAVMSGISALVFPLGDVFKALGRQPLYVLLMLVELPLMIVATLAASRAGLATVAWAMAGVLALHAVLVAATVGRVVGIRAGRFARALGPGLGAGAGMAAGAGAVRLAEVGPPHLELLAGGAAGTAATFLAARLLSPRAWQDLRAHLPAQPRPPRGWLRLTRDVLPGANPEAR